MQDVRVCPKCGWVYPVSYPMATCRFCHTIIPAGICRHCKQYTEHLVSDRMLCRVCYNMEHSAFSKQYYLRREEAFKESFETWLEQIKDLPKSLLTEQQWINTCLQFNSCAICRSESIDTRTFFIPFTLGGRYTSWNIFPTCERCNKIWQSEPNPFKNVSCFGRHDRRDFVDTESFNKLVRYLQFQIREVSK
jgi:hypothetical protein